MSWLQNEDKVEPQKSARGMDAAFCHSQPHPEYGKKGIPNVPLAEEGENQNSSIVY